MLFKFQNIVVVQLNKLSEQGRSNNIRFECFILARIKPKKQSCKKPSAGLLYDREFQHIFLQWMDFGHIMCARFCFETLLPKGLEEQK